MLGKTAKVVSGMGSSDSPLQVTVDADSSATEVSASDIVPTDSNLATVQFYGTDSTFTNTTTTGSSISLSQGENNVYATVEAQDGAILDYAITVNSSAAPDQDQAAPTGLAGVAPTTANNDGKITGVTDSMEYQLQGAANYTSVTGSATEITGLAAGTYEVRYAAKAGFNAGTAAEVVVAAYVAGNSNVPVTGVTLNQSTLNLKKSRLCT